MPEYITNVFTGQDGSGEDPGPVIHGRTVEGKVDGAADENATALRINVVQIYKEDNGKRRRRKKKMTMKKINTPGFKTFDVLVCIRSELYAYVWVCAC